MAVSRQGGVLSPVCTLICVYFDGLLYTLSNAEYGCYIGCTFAGVLAYADDIVLPAPSVSAMRKMLAQYDEFATEFSVVFNASKSKCLLLSGAASST